MKKTKKLLLLLASLFVLTVLPASVSAEIDVSEMVSSGVDCEQRRDPGFFGFIAPWLSRAQTVISDLQYRACQNFVNDFDQYLPYMESLQQMGHDERIAISPYCGCINVSNKGFESYNDLSEDQLKNDLKAAHEEAMNEALIQSVQDYRELMRLEISIEGSEGKDTTSIYFSNLLGLIDVYDYSPTTCQNIQLPDSCYNPNEKSRDEMFSFLDEKPFFGGRLQNLFSPREDINFEEMHLLNKFVAEIIANREFLSRLESHLEDNSKELIETADWRAQRSLRNQVIEFLEAEKHADFLRDHISTVVQNFSHSGDEIDRFSQRAPAIVEFLLSRESAVLELIRLHDSSSQELEDALNDLTTRVFKEDSTTSSTISELCQNLQHNLDRACRGATAKVFNDQNIASDEIARKNTCELLAVHNQLNEYENFGHGIGGEESEDGTSQFGNLFTRVEASPFLLTQMTKGSAPRPFDFGDLGSVQSALLRENIEHHNEAHYSPFLSSDEQNTATNSIENASNIVVVKPDTPEQISNSISGAFSSVLSQSQSTTGSHSSSLTSVSSTNTQNTSASGNSSNTPNTPPPGILDILRGDFGSTRDGSEESQAGPKKEYKEEHREEYKEGIVGTSVENLSATISDDLYRPDNLENFEDANPIKEDFNQHQVVKNPRQNHLQRSFRPPNTSAARGHDLGKQIDSLPMPNTYSHNRLQEQLGQLKARSAHIEKEGEESGDESYLQDEKYQRLLKRIKELEGELEDLQTVAGGENESEDDIAKISKQEMERERPQDRSIERIRSVSEVPSSSTRPARGPSRSPAIAAPVVSPESTGRSDVISSDSMSSATIGVPSSSSPVSMMESFREGRDNVSLVSDEIRQQDIAVTTSEGESISPVSAGSRGPASLASASQVMSSDFNIDDYIFISTSDISELENPDLLPVFYDDIYYLPSVKKGEDGEEIIVYKKDVSFQDVYEHIKGLVPHKAIYRHSALTNIVDKVLQH